MQLFVRFLVIGFLKQYVGTYTRILELAVVLYRGRRNVHIHPADRPIFMLDTVNRFDRFKNILYRIVYRIFTRFQRQTLMTHILQRCYLTNDLLLRKFFARYVMILAVIRTVDTAVDTVIR